MQDTNILEIIAEKMLELGEELKKLNEMCPEYECMEIRTLNINRDEIVITLHLDKEDPTEKVTVYRFEGGRTTVYEGGEQVYETV